MPIFDNGTPVNQDSFCCITAEDILAYNPCWTEQFCVVPDRLEEEACAAMEVIQLMLNKNYCPIEGCKTFSGSGHNILFLGQNYLHSLTSISYTNCNNCEVPTVDPTNLNNQLQFDCCDYKFPCGENNISICGEWGRPLPLNIKKVAIQMAIEATHPGMTGLTSSNGVIDSVNWSDVSISYAGVEGTSGMTTGFVELDRILELYLDAGDQIGYSVIPKCPDSCNCGSTLRCRCGQ